MSSETLEIVVSCYCGFFVDALIFAYECILNGFDGTNYF